jgi:hypothetical protein
MLLLALCIYAVMVTQRCNAFSFRTGALALRMVLGRLFCREPGINARFFGGVSPNGLFAQTLSSLKILSSQALVPHGL